MSPTDSHRLSRRGLLGGAIGLALGGAACTPTRPDLPPSAPGAPTVSSLIATDPFYIAHRGGGGDWPELTAYAYQQAARIPDLHALEISVCLSSDGVLVCSHDPTTARLTGTDYTIADETWATLSSLQVSGAETGDPSQRPRPLTRFDEVAEAYIGAFVLFVEPKVSRAAAPLLDRLVGLGQPDRVVWKQPVNATGFAAAKRQGFATWGYVLDEPAHTGANLRRFAADDDIDLLGAPRSESDDFIRTVVAAAAAQQKQTISWAIRSTADRDRVLGLGCQGLMTSNVTEVLAAPR